MKKSLKYALPVFALAVSLAPFAQARPDRYPPPPHDPTPGIAPEIDPGLAIGGLTLLGGTLTVLRARRRK